MQPPTFTDHFSLVADAARRLHAALDPTALEAAVAELAGVLVPAAADWCLIELVSHGHRGLHLAALAHRDPAHAERGRRTHARAGAPGAIVSADQPILVRAGEADHPLAGELGWTAWITAPLVGRGRVAGVLTLAVDGERALGPAELELAGAVASIAGLALGGARVADEREEILSVVSHDLRNPLGVILLVMDFLGHDSLPTSLRAHLGRLERAAHSMNRIVSDMVDFGRLGSPSAPLTFEQVSARSVLDTVAGAVQAAADERKVTLERSNRGEIQMEIDRGRLCRALELVLSAAVQRTPSGGAAALAVEQVGDEAVWSVIDGAPQNPATPARRRVGPFAWVAAQAVVSAHGGTVWVEHGEAGNTVARLAIPLRRPAVRRAPAVI